MQRIRIGKVPIDVVTFPQAMEAIERLVAAKQGGAVFTPNLAHVVACDENPAFHDAYQAVSLSLADGTWVVWASQLVETRLPAKISGSDLVVPLLELAGQKRWRVGFIGAGPGVAEKAAGIARTKWGTDVVLVDAPKIRVDDEAQLDQLAAALNAAKVDVVVMALGTPNQEIFIGRMRHRVKSAVFFGLGASLDFITGTVKRAPRVVSRLGLEWAFRLVQEPKRLWRRYLINDPKAALIIAKQFRDR